MNYLRQKITSLLRPLPLQRTTYHRNRKPIKKQLPKSASHAKRKPYQPYISSTLELEHKTGLSNFRTSNRAARLRLKLLIRLHIHVRMSGMQILSCTLLTPTRESPVLHHYFYIHTVFTSLPHKEHSISKISPGFQIPTTRKDIEVSFGITDTNTNLPKAERF